MSVEDIQKYFYDNNTKVGCDNCDFRKECNALTEKLNKPDLCSIILGEIDTE